MKTILIKLTQQTIFWNIFNGFITLLTTEFSGINYIYTPFILGLLSLITKELNKKFNPYYK